jgi:hypothetical protein
MLARGSHPLKTAEPPVTVAFQDSQSVMAAATSVKAYTTTATTCPPIFEKKVG